MIEYCDERMSEIDLDLYTNPLGKRRLGALDAEQQSTQRQQWFAAFEPVLRSRLPEDIRSVRLKIVGSVARGQASADSDIDVVISGYGSDSGMEAAVRHEAAHLLNEMKASGQTVYDLEFHRIVDYSSLFGAQTILNEIKQRRLLV